MALICLIHIFTPVKLPIVTTPKWILRDDIKCAADMQDGGNGKITGTTKVKGSPDAPVSRRVRLMREKDNICIREAWSDPTTGAYQFLNINPAVVYTVITYDHTKNYRAVIADGLVPEIMT